MADHFSTTIRATTEVALEKAMFLLGKSKIGGCIIWVAL